MERSITDLAGMDDVRTKIVGQRPEVAINFEPIGRGMRVDATEFERPFHSVGKSAKDRQPIRNYYFVALAHWLQNSPAGKDAGDVTKPMLQDLRINPQRQGIKTAHFDPLSPMRRRVGIEKRTVQALQSQIVQTAKNLFGQQLLHEQVAA